MNTNQPAGLTDQEMLTDALSSQKFATENYNLFANECASPALKSECINILTEEHQIQHEVFLEMQKRGWYPVTPAQPEKITTAKEKYKQKQL